MSNYSMQVLLTPSQRYLLGAELEDIVEIALMSFLPFGNIGFERKQRTDKTTDFHITFNGIVIISIEVKNWENETSDNYKRKLEEYVRKQILQRYDGTPSYAVKLLIGHIALEEKHIRLLRRRGILYYKLPFQLIPESEIELLRMKNRTVNEMRFLKKTYVKDLIKTISDLIANQTGKHNSQLVSRKRIEIVGGRELHIHSITSNREQHPYLDLTKESDFKPIYFLNIHSKKYRKSQSFGCYHSKWIKVGLKPNDELRWIVGLEDSFCIMFVPIEYIVNSKDTVFQERVFNANELEQASSRMDQILIEQKSNPSKQLKQMKYLARSRLKGIATRFKIVSWQIPN